MSCTGSFVSLSHFLKDSAHFKMAAGSGGLGTRLTKAIVAGPTFSFPSPALRCFRHTWSKAGWTSEHSDSLIVIARRPIGRGREVEVIIVRSAHFRPPLID